MNNIFNPENPWMRFLGKAFDLMMINILTFLLMIPIITIGPAITAMFYSLSKVLDDNETSTITSHLAFFKKNLKAPIIVMILHSMLLLGFLAYLSILSQNVSVLSSILRIVIYLLLGISAVIVTYAYGLLAYFNNDALTTLRNAVMLMIAYMPSTLFIVLTYGVFGYLSIRFFAILAPIVFLLGLVLPSLIVTFLLRGIFRKVTDEPI